MTGAGQLTVCLYVCRTIYLWICALPRSTDMQPQQRSRCKVKGGAHTMLWRWWAETLDNHKSCLWIEQTFVWVAVALSVGALVRLPKIGSGIRCITEWLWTGSKQIADYTLRATGPVSLELPKVNLIQTINRLPSTCWDASDDHSFSQEERVIGKRWWEEVLNSSFSNAILNRFQS